MRAKRRYLPGNKGTEGPSSLLFFDSESYSNVSPHDPDLTRLTLRLWCATALRLEGGRVTRRVSASGLTAAEFWRFVESCQSPHRVLWAFAHNLGFDLTQLQFWDQLDLGVYTIGPVDRGVSHRTGKPIKPWVGRLCLESRPTFCVVKGSRGKVRFVDTGNYWPTSLESIGESFGLPKLKMPAFTEPDSVWFPYCARDVEVCERAVVALLQQWSAEKCGVFRMTSPGLAFQHFKHTCHARAKKGESVNIVLEDDSPSRPLERDGYYGGRIEPFYVGHHRGPIYHFDCNSLYPAMMAGSTFPRARVQSYGPIEPDKLNRLLSAYGAVARVKIESHTDTYIVRRNGLQYHARGFFWTTLCGPELQRALTAGAVQQVSEAHTYSMCDLFSKWVDYWYNRKNVARSAEPPNIGEFEFVNLILKSLSGKFAQLGEYWQDRTDICPRGRWGHWMRTPLQAGEAPLWRAIAGTSQCKTPGAEPGEAFPIISAYITSYAREYMRSIFRGLPPKSVLYTATDSIVCTRPGYLALDRMGLIHPTALGSFKLVDGSLDCDISGPNYYRLGGRLCRSGLYAKAQHIAGRGWTADAWQRLPGILSSRPDGSVLIKRHDLKGSQVNQKGTVGDDGWVRPLWCPDGEALDWQWPKKRELTPRSGH